MRAVVDTNVWVSAALQPGGLPAHVASMLESERFVLLSSKPLLAELSEVLSSPRIARRYRLNPEKIDAFVTSLEHRAELVPVTGMVSVCRDPDDNVVIETAVSGSADCIVTGDQDLAAAEVVDYAAEHGISVRSVRQFIELLELSETQ